MEEGAEGGPTGQAGPAARHLTDEPGWWRWLPAVIVVVASAWLTRGFWFPGRFVVGFDTYAYSGPNLAATEAAIRDGRLPILNDLIFTGVPHLGNPQAGVLYPAHLLTLVFDTNRAMGVIVSLHVVILGLGMLVLARRLGFERLGATVSALAAVAAGAMLTKTVQFEQILVLAWAPLLVAAIHATLHAEHRWRSCAALSATTAAVLLAGHPQLVYETIAVAIAATVGFAIGEERWRRLPVTAVGVALGVLIALPQLVAALYTTADSAIRVGRPLAELGVPARALLPAYTARAMFGTVQDRDPAIFAGGFESIGFVGVVVAVLAVIGAVQAVRTSTSRSWAISFMVLGAIALLWSYGPRTFLFRVAYEILPGFDLARASARWLVVVVLVGALFAGVGADVLRRGATRLHAAVVAAVAGLVVLVIAVGPMITADARSATIWAVTAVVAMALVAANAVASTGGRRHTIVVATTVAVVGLAVVELGAMSLHSVPQRLRDDEPFTAHETETTRWLAEQSAGSTIALTDDGAPVAYQMPGLRPNANVVAGVPSPDGYDGGVQITTRWAEALRRFTPAPAIELPLRNSLHIPIDPAQMARLGVRFVLLDRDRPAEVFVPGWEGPRAADDEFDVYENPLWIGDAVSWPQAEPVIGSAPDMLREELDQVRGVALVDRPDAALRCEGAGCAPVAWELDSPRPEHLTVRVELDRESIVSVARQALPGWSVQVDGDDADEVVVDGLFLGVEVPAGEHTVTWRYHSPWLTWTIIVSLLALAATIFLAVADTVPRWADFSRGGRDRPIDSET